jgi:hypothetical protein
MFDLRMLDNPHPRLGISMNPGCCVLENRQRDKPLDECRA